MISRIIGLSTEFYTFKSLTCTHKVYIVLLQLNNFINLYLVVGIF
jgi:hypothetical protein